MQTGATAMGPSHSKVVTANAVARNGGAGRTRAGHTVVWGSLTCGRWFDLVSGRWTSF
jgi:hypothetical protein